MSVIAAPECMTPNLASFIRKLNFCIVHDVKNHRAVIYVDYRLHGDTNGKTAYDETKFRREHGKLVACDGQISDPAVRVVEALTRFIRHPFDRYTGIRISAAFDKSGYQSKIVIKLDHGSVAEVCYAIAKALFVTCFRAHINYADSDTLSQLEAEDRRIDSPVPAYAMSH